MSCRVEIYTRAYCPNCQRAKDLLRIKGVAFIEHELTPGDLPHDFPPQATVIDAVPKIFINRHIIEGCAELFELDENGKLDTLLNLELKPLGSL